VSNKDSGLVEHLLEPGMYLCKDFLFNVFYVMANVSVFLRVRGKEHSKKNDVIFDIFMETYSEQ
jgi:hypothetical protein